MSTYGSEKVNGKIVEMCLVGESISSILRMLPETNHAGDELTANEVWKIADANGDAAVNSYGANQRSYLVSRAL
tara:strand:+ start:585 stop:806 length:222 start_codon:yes stop_codon:yes gene_type:complete